MSIFFWILLLKSSNVKTQWSILDDLLSVNTWPSTRACHRGRALSRVRERSSSYPALNFLFTKTTQTCARRFLTPVGRGIPCTIQGRILSLKEDLLHSGTAIAPQPHAVKACKREEACMILTLTTNAKFTFLRVLSHFNLTFFETRNYYIVFLWIFLNIIYGHKWETWFIQWIRSMNNTTVTIPTQWQYKCTCKYPTIDSGSTLPMNGNAPVFQHSFVF